VADAYVIEAQNRAAGLAVRDRRGFRFFAAEQPFFALDKRLFPSLRAIRHAVETIARRRNGDHAPRRELRTR
jgi:hypothetical protein